MATTLNLSRILVVKLADIGDVITATPALRAFRESYRGATVDLLTTPQAAAVVPRKLADDVLVAPRNLVTRARDVPGAIALLQQLRARHYDALVFLHHLTLRAGVAKYRLLAMASGAPVLAGLDNGRGGWLTHAVPDRGFGAVHEVEYWLAVMARLGAFVSDTALAARCSQEDIVQADNLLRQALAGGLRVVIHPGSGGYAPARRWDAAKWADLAATLVRRHGAAILVVGTASDGVDEVVRHLQVPVLNLAGRTTLGQLAALLARCDLFLGADSGVMHLAAAAGVPVVALFGPSNPLAWAPWTPDSPSRVVRLRPACSPCSYVGHSVGLRGGCWHRSCMADLEPGQVLAAIRDLGVLAEAKVIDA